MKSRSEIWLCALNELGAQCSVSTLRDAETLAQRVAREGDTFFKVTLPTFGKDLELSLALRRIPPDLFTGFKRRKRVVILTDDDGSPLESVKRAGGNPQFLGGFLDLVFCDVPSVNFDDYGRTVAEDPSRLDPFMRNFSAQEVFRAADAITAIRQLCLMFGKEKEMCSPPRVAAAVSEFIETDKELDAPLGTSEP